MPTSNPRHGSPTSTSSRPLRSAVMAGSGILIATALAVSTAGGARATTASTAAAPTGVSACAPGELAYLVRLARNAEPGSAGYHRLIEEIDRLVWTGPGVR
jgi:hypothetical protein